MNSNVPGRHAGESFDEKNASVFLFGANVRTGTVRTARNGSLPVTLDHWLVGDEAICSVDDETGVSPEKEFVYPSLYDVLEGED